MPKDIVIPWRVVEKTSRMLEDPNVPEAYKMVGWVVLGFLLRFIEDQEVRRDL
jgi:hypothetical protein